MLRPSVRPGSLLQNAFLHARRRVGRNALRTFLHPLHGRRQGQTDKSTGTYEVSPSEIPSHLCHAEGETGAASSGISWAEGWMRAPGAPLAPPLAIPFSRS